jgi:hypothetical protein
MQNNTKKLIYSVLMMMVSAGSVSGQRADATARCQPDGAAVRVPELPEGSGVAVSRRHPGRIWAHNDSGQPVLIALNDRGAVVGRVRLTGVRVDNWEAIGVGACPSGSCVYLADIGDNGAKRKQVTVYRVPEPASLDETIPVQDAFHATYPGGAHDAEALLVMPTGDLLIVTKGEHDSIAMFRFPHDLRPGSTSLLERVGQPRDTGKSDGDLITDGAVSPNGRMIVLRTKRALLFYPAADLMAGNWREASRVDLKAIGEPQGEGVTFAGDTTLYLVGEGGGKSEGGTFARLSCTF